MYNNTYYIYPLYSVQPTEPYRSVYNLTACEQFSTTVFDGFRHFEIKNSSVGLYVTTHTRRFGYDIIYV